MAKRKLEIEILGDTSKLSKALKSGQADVGKFGHATDQLGAKVDRGFAGIAGHAVKMAAAVGGAFASIAAAKKAVDSTETLAKSTLTLAKSFGLTTKSASEWAAVSQARGTDGKTLTMGFKALSTQVNNARNAINAQGTGLDALAKKNALAYQQAIIQGKSVKDLTLLKQRQSAAEDALSVKSVTQAKAFQQLGISQADLLKHGDNLDYILGRVSDGLHKMPAGTERAAIQAKLFGRTWTTVAPLIRNGSKSMDEQLKQADKYGATFSGKSLKSLENFTKEQRQAKLASLGLQIQFGKLVAPVLTKGVELLAASVVKVRHAFKLAADKGRDFFDTFGDLRGKGKSLTASFSGAFSDAFGHIPWKKIGDKMSAGLSASLDFAGKIGPGVAAGIGFAFSHIDTKKVGSVLANVFGDTIDTVLNPAFWLHHIGLAFDLVTFVFPIGKFLKIPGASVLYKFISKPFFDAVKGVGAALVKAFGKIGLDGLDGFLTGLEKDAPKLGGFLIKLVAGGAKDLGKMPGKFAKVAKDAGSAVVGGIGSFAAKVGSVAGELVGKAVSPFEKLGSRIVSAVGKAFGSVLKFFTSLGDKIVSAIVDGIKAAPGAIVGAIKSAAGGAWKFAKKLLPGGRSGGRFTGSGFRRFAEGGLVPAALSPGELVRYGSQSAVVPGTPVAADSFMAALPPGAQVFTFDGQRMLSQGASPAQALAHQRPHFAAGGRVFGDKVTDSFTQGFSDGLTPGLRHSLAASLNYGTDKGGGPSASSATAGIGNLPSGSHIARMAAKAEAITGRQFPYLWGGGHDATFSGPYDCSGAVSAVLHAGGLLNSPLTSGALEGWGQSGAGKRLSVIADAKHTIMQIGGRYFGTSGSNPGGGAGWLSGNTMAGRGVTRTWPGFRAGGTVAGAINHVVGAPKQGTGSSLDKLLNILQGQTFTRLHSIESGIMQEIAALKKGGHGSGVKAVRLSRITDAIDAVLGAKVKGIVDQANTLIDKSTRRDDVLGRSQRKLGIDSGSVLGQGQTRSTLKADEGDLRDAKSKIQSALKHAKTKAIQAELKQQLQDVEDSLDENAAQYAEAARGQAQAFKDAMDTVSGSIDDAVNAAGDAWRTAQEAAIKNGPQASELAGLQAQDKAGQRAAEDASNQQALTDAQGGLDTANTRLTLANASGDPAYIAYAKGQLATAQSTFDTATKAINDTARSRREDELQDEITDQSDALDTQETNYKDSLAAQLAALQTNLGKGLISYADFVKQASAILAPLGVSFGSDSSLGQSLGSGSSTAATTHVSGGGSWGGLGSWSGASSGGFGHSWGHASGGLLGRVGEVGPEMLLAAPGGNVRVLSASQTAQKGNGPLIGEVHIHGGGAKLSEARIARKLAHQLKYAS